MTTFRLADFVLDDVEEDTSIPVCIPRTSFRIHPDKSRSVGPIPLARIDNEWWLIHPTIVAKFKIPHLWKAALFEGIRANGASFLLPLTSPLPGCEAWYDTLQEGIVKARKRWVVAESDRDQGRYNIILPRENKLAVIEWPDWDFDEMVAYAFGNRTVSTEKDAMAMFSRKVCRRMIEEDQDD